MAQFTGYPQAKNDPSYLISKEPDKVQPNTTISSALSGTAETFGLAVKGLDEVNKLQIDDELRQRIDRERQSDIGAGQSLLAQVRSGPNAPNTGGDISSTMALGATRNVPGEGSAEAGRVVPPQMGGSLTGGSEAVPNDVTTGVRQMNMLSQASRQGRLQNNVDYYGRIQELTQSLISRYPGYRGYIEDKATSILGVNPANAQRTAITQTLQTLAGHANSEEEKWRNHVREMAPYFPAQQAAALTQYALSPEVTRDKNRQNAFIAMYAGNRAADHQQERDLRTLNLRQNNRTATVNDTEDTYNSIAASEVNKAFTNMTFGFSGGTFDYATMTTNINRELRNTAEGRPDPTQRRILGEQLATVRANLSANLDALARRPEFTQVNADNLQKIRDRVLSPLKVYEGMIGEGYTTAAGMIAATVKTTEENAAFRALAIPKLQQIHGFQAVVGQQVAAQLLSQQNVMQNMQLMPEIGRNLWTIRTLELGMPSTATPPGVPGTTPGTPSAPGATPQGDPRAPVRGPVVADALGTTGLGGLDVDYTRYQQTNNGATPPPSYLNGSINLIKEMLKQKDNPQAAVNAASVIFHQGTTNGFIQKLEPEQQFEAFARLSSPDVASRMKELAQTNPSIYANYRTWAQRTFQQLFNENIDNVQRQVTTNQRLNIGWNESAQQLTYSDPRANVRGPNARSTGIGLPEIDQLNMGFSTLRTVLENDPRGSEKITPELLKTMGIDLERQSPGLSITGQDILRVLRSIGEEATRGTRGVRKAIRPQ